MMKPTIANSQEKEQEFCKENMKKTFIKSLWSFRQPRCIKNTQNNQDCWLNEINSVRKWCTCVIYKLYTRIERGKPLALNF